MMKTKRTEMAQEIERLHAEGMAMLRAAYPERQQTLDEVDQVPVELSNRLVSCGGRAFTRIVAGKCFAVKIVINARLHELNPGNLRQTYLHELAHIAANLLSNANQKHGDKWKEAMLAMGLTPDVYHKMDCSALRTKRKNTTYRYGCGQCLTTSLVSARMHNKISKGVCRCGRCGSKDLRLLKVTNNMIG